MQSDWSRVVTLNDGVAMVVTDLHGDWARYQTYRDLFTEKYRNGEAHYLIFTGDLIHSEASPNEDESIAIVLDVIRMRKTYPGAVIYLCGNHEMPHIYGVSLSKRDMLYSARFEAAMGSNRDEILHLFRTLPFFVRTRAGVSITHAGASEVQSLQKNCERLFTFDHQAIFQRVDAILKNGNPDALRQGFDKLSGDTYPRMAQKYLAISGPDDPRYNDLLRGFFASSDPDFELLWAALFTRCEYAYGNGDYGIFLDNLLKALSTNFYDQNVLVAGHIIARNGYEIIARRHLRIAGGKHARPQESARYLCFDVSKPVSNAKDLLPQLQKIIPLRK